jgi:hypothetical protein
VCCRIYILIRIICLADAEGNTARAGKVRLRLLAEVPPQVHHILLLIGELFPQVHEILVLLGLLLLLLFEPLLRLDGDASLLVQVFVAMTNLALPLATFIPVLTVNCRNLQEVSVGGAEAKLPSSDGLVAVPAHGRHAVTRHSTEAAQAAAPTVAVWRAMHGRFVLGVASQIAEHHLKAAAAPRLIVDAQEALSREVRQFAHSNRARDLRSIQIKKNWSSSNTDTWWHNNRCWPTRKKSSSNSLQVVASVHRR